MLPDNLSPEWQNLVAAGQITLVRSDAAVSAAGRTWTAKSPAGLTPPIYGVGEQKLLTWHHTDAGYGAWKSAPFPVTGGQSLRISIDCAMVGGKPVGRGPKAILSWESATGFPVAREYLDTVQVPGETGLTMQRYASAPPEADHFCLLLGSPPAQEPYGVIWDTLVEIEPIAVQPPAPLPIAAVTLHIGAGATMPGNLQLMLQGIATAASANTPNGRPRLVLLSECVLDRNVAGCPIKTAVTLDGPEITALQSAAREHTVWVCTSVHERVDNRFYNTAVLIDDTGCIQGTYRKNHLTMTEYENGLTPGDSFPVFDTPLGRIGMLVCWDLWFTESVRILALQGADIVLVPLAGDGSENHMEHVWRTRAMDNNVSLVVSGTNANTGSWIIDPSGSVLAITHEHCGVAAASLPLGVQYGLPWLSAGRGFGETANYIHERRPDLYQLLTSPPGSTSRPGQEYVRERRLYK